jgi:NADPH:quinone reductase-like Zn-dependent oxidoreductase
VQVGDEVTLSPGISCGQCPACLRGNDNLCPQYGLLGARRNGTNAEFVVVPAVNVLPKPANLTFEEAAAFPLVFLTAWNMLVTQARVRPGEDVVVWGAGSGVGSAGIQIAKAHHARVIAIAGDDWKLERARALGADEGINYKREDVADRVRELTGGKGADVVLDHVGAATWEVSLRSLRRGGRLALCGATTGSVVQTDIRYIFGKAVTVYGTYMGGKWELWELLPLIERGVLKPVVDRVFPLSEVQEAHAFLEAGQQFGKVVLVP